jgi:hypothetical protein
MPEHVRRLAVAFLPLISFAAACSAGPSAANAESPSLFWQGVKTVAVVCLVQSRAGNRPDLAAQLCARVRELASQGAPGPVRVVEMGDRALVDPASVTLLVHASVEQAPGGQAVAFTMRPHRALGGQDEILFGSSPRTASLKATGPIGASLDPGLSAALGEILPWRTPLNPMGQPLNLPTN